MAERPWSEIDRVSPEELGDPVLQLHWASQLVASAGQTFAEPLADDSHRAMTWSDLHGALVGTPFAGPYPFRVALRPADLTLLLLDRTEQTLGALPLRGLSRGDGYDWLALAVATYLGGAPPRIERPEYDVPSHPVGQGQPFDADAEALSVLASLYGSAADLLAEMVEARPDASAVRCWPHNFDIGTLITLPERGEGGVDRSVEAMGRERGTGAEKRDAGGEPAVESERAAGGGEAIDRGADRTVGVGMAPMGGGYEGWYWYVTPWPYPDPADLPELAAGRSWHTEGWVGAVLPGEEVTRAARARRRGLVRAFLDEAIAAAQSALSRTAG